MASIAIATSFLTAHHSDTVHGTELQGAIEHQPPARTPLLPSMSKRASSPTDVIDRSENDGENVEEEYGNATVRSLRRRLLSIPATVAATLRLTKRVKRERTGEKRKRKRATLASSTEDMDINEDVTRDRKPAAKTTTVDNEEEDVEVLEAPASRNIPTAATAAARSSSSDEIEVVGTVNQVLLPHMRQHCTEELFSPFRCSYGTAAKEERLTNNVKICSLCYCYVCDVKASKCPKWHQHCSASDSGPTGHKWAALREKHKQHKKKHAVTSNWDIPTPAATGGHQAFAGAGPFPPDTVGASGPNTILTKCRKCGWFNKFAHKDFKFDRQVAKGTQMGRTVPRWYHSNNDYHRAQLGDDEIHPTGFMDWCHACGYVASERDLCKVQSQSYVPSQYSILLGTKTVDFCLKAHDPRDMEQYSEKWVQEEWTHNESEMEQELFDHRLGKFPVLEMIVASMPITTEDRIPSDGSHRENGYAGAQVAAEASVSETEAVLIGNHADSLVLKELFKTSPKFGTINAVKPSDRLYSYIDGDIQAVWDSSTRKGVRKVLFSSVTDPARLLYVLCFA
jgi:hypothetical protein